MRPRLPNPAPEPLRYDDEAWLDDAPLSRGGMVIVFAFFALSGAIMGAAVMFAVMR